MNLSRSLSLVSFVLVACSSGACSSAGSGGSSALSPSGSEVSVSVVSGALNNNDSGKTVGINTRGMKPSTAERVLAFMNPVSTAYAADWACSGASLSPSFNGAGAYSFTPPSCKVTWLGDISATSSWSGPFTLTYGSSCDDRHPFMVNQAAACDLVRTTPVGGETRTITGPLGGEYAITHDTNGAGSGWDSSLTPAPTDDGVELTCGASGCDSGGTLVINGSHLTGTVDLDKITKKIWDHTVTSSGITVTNSSAGLVVSGAVTVQHNLIKAVSTTTFDSVTYGDPGCCFPTDGSVSTTYSEGPTGKTEKLVFSATCGETTLTDDTGASASLTLAHCL